MVDRVCGTGGWGSAPLPGDPDNNSVLTATPAFGGIDVEWTYPEVNPGAVSHVIIYRSTAGTAEYAQQHKIVNGTFYFDRIDNATPVRYYYWIRIVSIHGTRGELIGPVSAIPRRTIEQTMRDLTGLIDQGVLATSLREEIGLIQTNKQELYDEMALRAANDDALGVAFNEVQAHAEETRALLQEEVQARVDANSAFVDSVNTVYATIGEEVAALQVSQSAFAERVDGDLVDLGAQFTVKADVNGLIGGFGVYNDGSIVEAGFDVDRFWVGRTETDGTYSGSKPFIIEGQETFIKEAVIKSLTFSKLRSDDGSVIVEDGKLGAQYIDASNLSVANAATFSGDVFSADFIPGQQGWAIFQNGYAEFNDASVRGTLDLTNLTVNGQPPQESFVFSGSGGSNSRNSENSVTFGGQYTARGHVVEMLSNSKTEVTVSPRVTLWFDTDRGIFDVWLDIRIRLLINGQKVIDTSSRLFTYYREEYSAIDLQGPLERNANVQPLTHVYTYPDYYQTSTIELIVDMTGHVEGSENAYLKYELDLNNSITGTVNRLG